MGWIDLHCHPLPGIDDGARTAEDGAALLAGLHGLGFETVVATPHVRSGVWDNRLESRAAAHALLEAMLAEARRRGETLPALLLAGEHMFDDVFHDLLRKGEALTYPGGGAALVEFAYDSIPMRVELQLWRMAKTVRPVLAHPERYTPVQQSDDKLDELVGAGAWLLLDLMSLVGAYGRRAQAAAERILAAGKYTAACSDAHKASDVPVVAQGIAALRAAKGEAEVRRLLIDGPAKILAAAGRA
ncbi:MAG: protein tyrosine phosphatase [Myxococcaceae bacterium]|nr:MAG: protein tyrosine phosphatase [Myxococcaceae bacterium]